MMMTEKYISPHELPNDHEQELLICLIEECSEVIQRATKLLRFGAEEKQSGQEKTNTERLSEEFGDLLEVSNMLIECGIILLYNVEIGKESKRKKLKKYLQTNKE